MRRALILPVLAALLLAGALASIATAKPPPDKGPGKDGPAATGVIYAGSAQGFWEMAADGSSQRLLGCGGDLSYPKIVLSDTTDQLLLSTPYVDDYDPFGTQLQRPVVVPFGLAEAGACSSRPVTVDFPAEPIHGWQWAEDYISIMAARWSPAADAVVMLVWTGAVEDDRYVYGAYDLWLADAVPDSTTLRFTNLRDLTAESDDADRAYGLVGLPYSWSGDGEWITYWRASAPGTPLGVLVVNVATGDESYATVGYRPAFSHADGDYRIVFMRNTADSRRYLWTGHWDTAARQLVPDSITQVTTKKTGAFSDLDWPTWSHDGQHLAFSAAQGVGWANNYNMYRVRADGKGKAIQVNEFEADFDGSAPAWRADPTGE